MKDRETDISQTDISRRQILIRKAERKRDRNKGKHLRDGADKLKDRKHNKRGTDTCNGLDILNIMNYKL